MTDRFLPHFDHSPVGLKESSDREKVYSNLPLELVFFLAAGFFFFGT